MTPRHGFSLVELLVVITIIVVLLALLSPALDKAVYESELAACAAKLKAHGGIATLYAMDHRRSYLWRPAIRAELNWRPDYLAFTQNSPDWDDRPGLRRYMDINAIFVCPLNKRVDFELAEQYVVDPRVTLISSYQFWYGFRYRPLRGMFRLGDRLEWKEGASGSVDRFSVLASDTDMANFQNRWSNVGHPDQTEFLRAAYSQANGVWSFWARWENMVPNRGPIDRGFVFEDNSAALMREVILDDPRLIPVGEYSGLTSSSATRTWLPR